MKKSLCFYLSLLFILLFLHGCTNFQRPQGEWRCEELNIMLNFGENDGMNGFVKARGNIIIDNKQQLIVCLMSPYGSANIYLLDDYEEEKREIDPLFNGRFKNPHNNKMIFILNREKTEYIFTRVLDD